MGEGGRNVKRKDVTEEPIDIAIFRRPEKDAEGRR